mgnify:CR=1 FL=1
MTISSVDAEQQAKQQGTQRQADAQWLEAVQFGIRIMFVGVDFHGCPGGGEPEVDQTAGGGVRRGATRPICRWHVAKR